MLWCVRSQTKDSQIKETQSFLTYDSVRCTKVPIYPNSVGTLVQSAFYAPLSILIRHYEYLIKAAFILPNFSFTNNYYTSLLYGQRNKVWGFSLLHRLGCVCDGSTTCDVTQVHKIRCISINIHPSISSSTLGTQTFAINSRCKRNSKPYLFLNKISIATRFEFYCNFCMLYRVLQKDHAQLKGINLHT